MHLKAIEHIVVTDFTEKWSAKKADRPKAGARNVVETFRLLPMMGKELQPVVGARYPLSATSDAHRRMEAGECSAKSSLAI